MSVGPDAVVLRCLSATELEARGNPDRGDPDRGRVGRWGAGSDQSCAGALVRGGPARGPRSGSSGCRHSLSPPRSLNIGRYRRRSGRNTRCEVYTREATRIGQRGPSAHVPARVHAPLAVPSRCGGLGVSLQKRASGHFERAPRVRRVLRPRQCRPFRCPPPAPRRSFSAFVLETCAGRWRDISRDVVPTTIFLFEISRHGYALRGSSSTSRI